MGKLESYQAALYNESRAATKLKTLRNDALISRLALIHDGFVITHDIDDFEIIQKARPKLAVISAKEFFN